MGRHKKEAEEVAPEASEEATVEEANETSAEALGETPTETPVEEPKVEKSAGSWSVRKFGQVVRTYTTEVHGEKAEACAIEYAGKINGEVV